MVDRDRADAACGTRRDFLKTSTLVAGAELASGLGLRADDPDTTRAAWLDVEPTPPPTPEEHCNPHDNLLAGYVDPVAYLAEAPNENRLIWPLRAAVNGTVPAMLSLSAAAFALSKAPGSTIAGAPIKPPYPPKAEPAQILHGGLSLVADKIADAPARRAALATAFADLAVSGRRAFAEYGNSPLTERTVSEQAHALLKGVAGVTEAEIAQGVQMARARASQVAAYFSLVIPDPAARSHLGWIAVSGEDDPAHRPVNIPSLPFPQYNIDVPVTAPSGATVTVNARFAVISGKPQATPQPHIPPTDVVLLFIHGDGSRLEEATPLLRPLLAAGARHGVSYTILAVDLPSHGCTTMVDPMGPLFAGAPGGEHGDNLKVSRPNSYPILGFLESFLVGFVAVLDKKLGIAKQILGPMGGSLGGNLSLRLARRTDPWIRQSVAWSPASVWNSLADDFVKQAGPNHCATELHRAESAGTRAHFFNDSFDAKSTILGLITLVQPQGEYWYRDDWQPCKATMLQGARKERRELYSRIYRQWHYRMDWEQLIYSYNDADHGSKDPRWKSFRTSLLMASGSEDDKSKATQIYSSARELAKNISKTGARGRTFFIEHTGHSIHDERPALWAAQIDAFCSETRAGPTEWIDAAGKPLVRFTGSVHEWTRALQVAKTDAAKTVLQLTLSIRTGSDDLRGGSKPKDNADVILKRRSGDSITFANINRGKKWGNGQTQAVQLFLPPVKAGELESLTLRTQFGGGLAGDNWNVEHVVLHAVLG